MKKINKVFTSIFLTVICTLIVGFTNVDAYIKESTTGAANTDVIENGTTIIGITKFKPSTIVTAKRASLATMNDVSYNLDNPNYDGVHIYYYFYGWYEFDENNNSTPVQDKNKLNELNIFYVDNVEKVLTINYSGDSSVTFKTDKPNKDRNVTLANGVITVPATVKDLTVLKGKNEVAFYSKADESDMSFLENPTVGRIESRENSVASMLGDSSLTFQGDIEYQIKKDAINGNYVSVGIVRDDIPNLEDRNKIKFLVRDAKNVEGTVYTWDENNDDTMQPLDILFSEDQKSATIEVTWEEGNTQLFTVGVTNSSNLEECPFGEIEWGIIGAEYDEFGDIIEPGFNYDIDYETDTFTIAGNIAYFEGNDELSEGNRVEFLIRPNDKYSSSFKITVEGTAEDDLEEAKWDDFDGETLIIYTPKFTENNRLIKVHVTWEEGFTQTFTLDATGAILKTPSVSGN